MLRAATIKSFRCLRDVTIRFEPLTIVVGPNAAGKSTLLAALNPLERARGPHDFWRSLPGQMERIFESDDRPVVSRRDSLDQMGAINHFANADKFVCQTLQLDPGKLRQPNTVAEERQLARDGANLANVVATLPRRQQEQLASQFSRLVPVYGDVTPRPHGSGQHELRFQDRWHDTWYRPSNVSDGSLLVLALLVLGYQDPSPDLIAIEEFERGIHPYLMGEILSVLRKMTRGEVGTKPTQIVIATHSAELLEFADPKEVRFLSRTNDGGVVVEEAPTSTPDWEQVVKDHQGSLGNLWLSGGLGGVPGGLGT
jgi:predicted ATPase